MKNFGSAIGVPTKNSWDITDWKMDQNQGARDTKVRANQCAPASIIYFLGSYGYELRLGVSIF